MGTHFKGDKTEVRALDTYIKLVRAAESILSRVHHQTGDGLTVTQFGVMEALHHLGPMHQRKIGLKLLKSGGNVTMVIDNLERRKLVKRRRDQKDRRFVNVHLTPAGIKLITKVFPQRVASVKDEMSRLTAAEQEELGRLCRILGVVSKS
ncbi:MAG: MarR family transcriptional regulator [bacterium]